ncbi:hypothetical protein [Streptomyces sp. NPDC057579]|uniref:hypothetical protein n=1 Tax=Streptomyces sp. NPDC057579 TaxID=3346172 RepID=UPI0036CF2A42
MGWVRTRARQVAQQLGEPCDGGVPAWLGERVEFAAAVGALECGSPLRLTVVDAEGCAYDLVARREGVSWADVRGSAWLAA